METETETYARATGQGRQTALTTPEKKHIKFNVSARRFGGIIGVVYGVQIGKWPRDGIAVNRIVSANIPEHRTGSDGPTPRMWAESESAISKLTR